MKKLYTNTFSILIGKYFKIFFLLLLTIYFPQRLTAQVADNSYKYVPFISESISTIDSSRNTLTNFQLIDGGTKISFDIYSLRTSGIWRMGNAAYIIKYTPGTLANPILTYINPKFTNGSPTGSYDSAIVRSLFASNKSSSLQLHYIGGTGDLVTNIPGTTGLGEKMATIQLDFLQSSTNIQWDLLNSANPTISGGHVFSSYFGSYITAPLNLLQPIGGENFNPGSIQNITWISNINRNIKIELSLDNGNSWLTIDSSYPSLYGNYEWTVPDLPSTQCKIKISDVIDSNVFDISDSYFNISLPFVVNSPLTNAILTAGTFKYINWSTSSGISNVKLEYTSNNGSNWNPISASWPASYNSYPWTVPNISSTECKVKVSDKDNSSVNAESGVFIIQQNNQSNLLNFKIKDETGTVTRLRIESDKDSITKNIVQNEVSFTSFEVNRMKTDKIKRILNCNNEEFLKTRRILLFNSSGGKVGYINYMYKENSEGADAIIYVDSKKANEVGYIQNTPWKYFSKPGENIVYMLIPPKEKFRNIRIETKPLLFVHGMYGKFPYWGNQSLEVYQLYDGWQLYYPYDMHIEFCSNILEKAISKILSGEPESTSPYLSSSISIISHSMGGLVSRYYIQNTLDHKVNKLLMLGTPNNGALISFRSKENESFTGSAADFFNKDQNSPAHIDISPASNFIYNLKFSQIKKLGNRNNNQSYLVIAGTKEHPCLSSIHHEATDQEDGVVSVSSASMLDSLIPLATIHLEHTELPEHNFFQVISAFLNNNYDPVDDNNYWMGLIKSEVDGFYTTRTDVKKEDNSSGLDKTKGNLFFKFLGLNSTNSIRISPEDQNIYYLDFYKSSINEIFLNVNSENSNFYFARDGRIGHNFIIKPLGISLNTVQSNIRFKIRKFIKGKAIVNSINPNSFPYNSLQTNWITVNLTNNHRFLANANSYLNNNQAYSKNSSVSNFNIDNSIDTIAFYLSSNPNDTAFTNHKFKLTDPNNNIIDSVYASQHSNIIFEQSLEDAVAYYYIIDPEPGNWSAQYNPNISEPFLIAPIQSPVNPDLFFPDTVYAAGDSIKFFTTLPVEPGVTNLQYTANISFVRRGTNTELNLGNVVMVKKDYNTFGGQFFTRGIGEYRVKLELNCNYNNQNIHRENYNSISVSGIKAPISLYPKNDSINVPQTAYFKWNRNYNSEKYDLQIYKLGDTIPAFSNVNITDTTFAIDSMQRETSYFWRIRALNNIDTSNWSEPKFFTSIENIPDSVALNSPPDKSGGVFTPLSLQWNRSYNAENYQCQISTDSLFANLVFNDSTIIDTITTVDDLIFPQTYYWRVRAVNAGGSSEYSNAWTFNTVEPVSQSFVYVNIIPQGLYNITNNNLNRSDTVTAFLVNTSSPFNAVDSSIAILDSSLILATFEFSNAESGIYYLKINHRSSIETWSDEGGESFNRYGKNYFDFTTSGTQAYGSNMIQINGKWCIYSGDVNQDGNIDLTDIVLINNDAGLFSSGYLVTDLNGDYITDLTDLLMGFNNSSMFIAKITP